MKTHVGFSTPGLVGTMIEIFYHNYNMHKKKYTFNIQKSYLSINKTLQKNNQHSYVNEDIFLLSCLIISLVKWLFFGVCIADVAHTQVY